MATKVGRFRVRDGKITRHIDSDEDEFISKLNAGEGSQKSQGIRSGESGLAEAAKEFKKKSRERWGNRSNQASPTRPLLAAQNRDRQLKTPAQRFKAASRARHAGR